jgi:hypothetical protein
MIKINRFNIGKKNKYKGICIILFGCIKLERIYQGNNFLWRIEIWRWN